MSISPIFSLVVIMALGIAFEALRADDSSTTTEIRLRDALREARAQLSDAQNQVASLQAAKDQADKDNADLNTKNDALNAQVASLTTQGTDNKTASDKTIADLNAQVASQATQIAQLTQALAESKSACDQAKRLASEQEAAHAQLALQAALLQRLVDDRETKNLELYKTASEILTRYEKYSLGEALEAKEPFAGESRLKLEALVRDYKDQLLNQTVGAGAAKESTRSASSPASQASPQAGHESTAPTKT